MSSKNALQAAKQAAEEEKKKKAAATSAEESTAQGDADATAKGSAGEEKAKAGATEDKTALVSEVAEYLGLGSDAGLGEIVAYIGYEGTIEEIAKNLGVK